MTPDKIPLYPPFEKGDKKRMQPSHSPLFCKEGSGEISSYPYFETEGVKI